jgi:sugar (pentulose or hexulose) kinase
MSDDIVNRLREGTNDGLRAWDWMREAANEIEKLREVLKPFDGFPLHKWDGIGDDHVLYGPFTLGHVRKYLSGSCQAILDNSNYPEKPDSCARAALEGVTDKKGAGNE